jgi:pyruvate/2-oxoglutarate dehydrogenase complex dihydrolipoamide dehydrogenase (E3) component
VAERFDAIVIGVGQAAPALCARLDREGLKTAVIERKLLGGTCVNNGCVPTKTLVASARAAHMARRGREFGFAPRPVRVDMRVVKRRKDRVVRHSVDALAKWIGGMKHVSLVHGQAKFTAGHRVLLDGRELEAERVFINVGARASVPDLPGVREVPFFNNSSMMAVNFVPPHLLIIGGSYIEAPAARG